jgi:hypothetical protein
MKVWLLKNKQTKKAAHKNRSRLCITTTGQRLVSVKDNTVIKKVMTKYLLRNYRQRLEAKEN